LRPPKPSAPRFGRGRPPLYSLPGPIAGQPRIEALPAEAGLGPFPKLSAQPPLECGSLLPLFPLGGTGLPTVPSLRRPALHHAASLLAAEGGGKPPHSRKRGALRWRDGPQAETERRAALTTETSAPMRVLLGLRTSNRPAKRERRDAVHPFLRIGRRPDEHQGVDCLCRGNILGNHQHAWAADTCLEEFGEMLRHRTDILGDQDAILVGS
jgi:hypothetical protein